MALKIQRAVLDLVRQDTGGTVEDMTPDWLMRPGRDVCGARWSLVCRIYRELTGLELCETMPIREWRHVDGILTIGSSVRRIVEIDESQHFNFYRAKTLDYYPQDLRLAFDRNAWIAHSQVEPRQQSGKWAAPRPPLFPHAGGRHRQRAFRDALADILPLDHGFQPTLRIADFEVEDWIGVPSARKRMEDLLSAKVPKDQSDVSQDEVSMAGEQRAIH